MFGSTSLKKISFTLQTSLHLLAPLHNFSTSILIWAAARGPERIDDVATTANDLDGEPVLYGAGGPLSGATRGQRRHSKGPIGVARAWVA